jgi:hypothetical protein
MSPSGSSHMPGCMHGLINYRPRLQDLRHTFASKCCAMSTAPARTQLLRCRCSRRSSGMVTPNRHVGISRPHLSYSRSRTTGLSIICKEPRMEHARRDAVSGLHWLTRQRKARARTRRRLLRHAAPASRFRAPDTGKHSCQLDRLPRGALINRPQPGPGPPGHPLVCATHLGITARSAWWRTRRWTGPAQASSLVSRAVQLRNRVSTTIPSRHHARTYTCCRQIIDALRPNPAADRRCKRTGEPCRLPAGR